MRGADCLRSCHPHFRALARAWYQAGDDPRRVGVPVAHRRCRLLDQVVAGRQVFCHPQQKERHDILEKLIAVREEHDSAAEALLRDLEAAARPRPPAEHAAEAAPPRERLKARASGRAGDRRSLAGLLPTVLARLGGEEVEARTSGAPGPRRAVRAGGPGTPSRPVGQTRTERLALARVSNA